MARGRGGYAMGAGTATTAVAVAATPRPLPDRLARPGRRRHHKERFDPKAEMVFSHDWVYAGVPVRAGDDVPKDVKPMRLLMLWRRERIRLKHFVIPVQHDPNAPAPATPAAD